MSVLRGDVAVHAAASLVARGGREAVGDDERESERRADLLRERGGALPFDGQKRKKKRVNRPFPSTRSCWV